MALPTPLKTPVDGRDPPTSNLEHIRADLIKIKAEDDHLHHKYDYLHLIYTLQHIQHYNIIAFGHYESANLLAGDIKLPLVVKSYLDLGCGTGNTTAACIQRLKEQQNPQISNMKVVLIDGLQSMLTATEDKIIHFLGSVLDKDVFGELADIQSLGPFELITAQQVLTNCKLDNRAQQLRSWADLLHEDGQLLVDIPHPSRHPAPLFVASRTQSLQGYRPQILECFRVSDESVYDECRAYARELAQSAKLQILNMMPAQLPPRTIDASSILTSWFNNTRAASIGDDLGQEECRWFNRRWVSAATTYHQSKGFAAQADLAAVTGLLGRYTRPTQPPPLAASPTKTNQTKYNIDQSLTGKARERAKKNAAKREKKQLNQGGKEHGEHGDDGDNGQGGLPCSHCKACYPQSLCATIRAGALTLPGHLSNSPTENENWIR